MKITIYIESDDSFGEQYVKFTKQYDSVMPAIVGLREMVEKYQTMADGAMFLKEPDRQAEDNESAKGEDLGAEEIRTNEI